jgi:hypothetical protein
MTQPSRRDRYRPVEFIGISFALAAVAGVIVWISSRDLKFVLISFGVSFVVLLVLFAMFVLAIKPNKEEITDIEEMSAEDSHH